ncbi:MAG: amidohydrolase family protein [Armatimonadetes bacterium]|nr:amidohydrolase family protein [Armatimonadota bacterium]
MTLYDAQASIGSWPFRGHRTRTAAQLLERLDEAGIQRAAVASLSAVCYRDCQAGNEELIEEIAPHRARLTPFGVLNPAYAGWERDLADGHETHGWRGVRLYPNYHNYDLAGPDGQRILGALSERGLVAAFVCRHEDRRQRHWLDVPEDLEPATLAGALLPYPALRFLILNGLGVERSPFGTDAVWRERAFGVDLCRGDVVLRGSVQKMIEAFGAEKVLFATGLPLQGPGSALLKLQMLEVDEPVREGIAGGNLARLLGEAP